MITIEKHYSLIHADRVLTMVRFILGKEEGKAKVGLEVWANGREQGYCLSIHKMPSGVIKLVFAQHRSSESILVICSLDDHFDSISNNPNEAAWKRAKSFESDRDAAKYIVDCLLGKQ